MEKIDETSLPNRESFHSDLNFKGINEPGYKHGKNVWSGLEMKCLGDYHELYV